MFFSCFDRWRYQIILLWYDLTSFTNALNQNLNILLGNYQLKVAKSYLRKHLSLSEIDPDESEFIFELWEQHGDPFKIRFSSWRSNEKFYIATVQYASDEDEQIKGWHCTCFNDSRVHGYRSYIAALLWYYRVCGANVDDEHRLSAQKLLHVVKACINVVDDDEDPRTLHILTDDSNGMDFDG